MKSRMACLGVLLASVLGLLATMVPVASADTYKTVTFAGDATLACSGLGYPVTVTPTTVTVPALPTLKPGPKPPTSVANIPPQGNHCGFQITSTVCVKTSVGKKVGAEACLLRASGTVWGYCGYSTGLGTATVTAPIKGTVSTPFKFTGVGGLLTVTGGNEMTNIVGEVVAVPTAGSCATETATGFTVAGEVVYKDCTDPGTTAGVCDPTPPL